MALSEREPDGTLWLLQDETCGHILLIPANEDDVYEWDYAQDNRFASEEEALAWHNANCPKLHERKRR
jgi:hypothetical protein